MKWTAHPRLLAGRIMVHKTIVWPTPATITRHRHRSSSGVAPAVMGRPGQEDG